MYKSQTTIKSTTKEITTISVFVAILIISQMSLTAINGVELVTVLIASFVFCYGLRIGFIAVNSFITIRGVIYGFYPSVMILYFAYYNLFVLLIGLIGNKSKHNFSRKSFIISLTAVIVLVFMFTLLDDIITPIYYNLDYQTAKAYWLMSLTAVIPQEICAILTMIFLFPILVKTFKNIKNNKGVKTINEYRTV